MMRCATLVLAALATSIAPARTQGPPGFDVETVVTGLDLASAFAFAPDGRLFVLERGPGRVRVVENGVLGGVWANPSTTLGVGEGGLLGIAIDPDFLTTPYVYLYYTRQAAGRWEAVIERWLESNGVGTSPTLIGPTMLASGRHCGGPLVFGRDGTLFAVTGEGGLDPLAQSLAHPNGKVLRLLVPGGTAPLDNPFVGVAGASPWIWAYGIRNSFGLAVHPLNGELYETENSAGGGDELNRIVRGGNHGWPMYDGFEPVPDPSTVDPLWTRRPDPAFTGAAFVTGALFPATLRGALIAGAYNDGGLYAFDIDPQTATVRSQSIFDTWGSTFGLADGPDGALYALAHPTRFERGADRIVRYVPQNLPSPALQIAAVSNQSLGGSISFGVITDPGDIAFAWVSPTLLPQPVPTPFGTLIVPVVLPLPAAVANADRRAFIALSLPDDPNLRGVTIHAQVAAIAGPNVRIGSAASFVLW